MKNLRSSVCTTGRKMAGARSLWRANGMKEEQFGQPVIAVVNSFTQFVPGHVHLHEIGQQIKEWIAEEGCFAAEFNTIAIDDGIAMGHDAVARPDRRQRRIYVQRAQGGRDDLHFELRQDYPGDADGRDAAEHSGRFRVGGADGDRTARRPRLRPDRRDGQGSRQGFFGRRFVETRTRRLSDLRFVLRYVYRQLDELSDRGAGTLAAR